MALKFFKVLNGIKALFKDTRPTEDTKEYVSSTTIDNLTDTSKNKGVDNNSIVITQATAEDSDAFGGKYIPGTNIMFTNGQTFVDASNVVQGVYTKVTSQGALIFCAPKGSFLEDDKVQFARHIHQQKSGTDIYNGIIIPEQSSVEGDQIGHENSSYTKYTLHLRKLTTSPVENSVWNYTVYATDGTTEITLVEYLKGLTLTPLKTVAFSVYRNGVQITDWFTWEVNYNSKNTIIGLKRSKGLYLPGVKEVLYSKLVSTQTNSKLIPGRYYKIIDYYPKANNTYYTDCIYPLRNKNEGNDQAPGPVYISDYWQIIVQALNSNTLSENAIAIRPDQQQVREVKYELIPNTTKHQYADSTSTGWVYYMKDQDGNEADFDFANLKVKVNGVEYFMFDDSCKNNSVLLTAESHGVVLKNCQNLFIRGCVINHIFEDESQKIVNKEFEGVFKNPGSPKNRILMADGTTKELTELPALSATAKALPAGSNPTVTVNNGNFEFGIPAGGTSDDITYNNSTEMPETLGGLQKGTIFEDMPLNTLLTNLLYPYQYPTAKIVCNTTDWEYGMDEKTLEFEVTGKSKQEDKTISYYIGTKSSPDESDFGTLKTFYISVFSRSEKATCYGQVKDKNDKKSPIVSVTVTPKYRYWIVASNDAPDLTNTPGSLTYDVSNIKKEWAVPTTSTNPYVYIITPSSWSFKIKSLGNDFTAYTSETTTYTPTGGTEQLYKRIKFTNPQISSTTFTIA